MNTKTGSIGWIDLTVPDAKAVGAFYEAVVGWKPQPLEMDGYSDYCMVPPGSDDPVSGICHARGPNAGLPASWLIYITVADLARSVDACRAGGGEVVHGPREIGGARMAVIRDPAGAVCGLFQPANSDGADST
jgi:predicted enzyme related to lactoylglutathione lyase